MIVPEIYVSYEYNAKNPKPRVIRYVVDSNTVDTHKVLFDFTSSFFGNAEL